MRILSAAITTVLLASLCMALGDKKAPSDQSSGKTGASAMQSKDLIDINSASKEQLASLPGIGAVYSQKIIDGRPYSKKTDLVQRKVIPEATYKKISGMIIAKQK